MLSYSYVFYRHLYRHKTLSLGLLTFALDSGKARTGKNRRKSTSAAKPETLCGITNEAMAAGGGKAPVTTACPEGRGG